MFWHLIPKPGKTIEEHWGIFKKYLIFFSLSIYALLNSILHIYSLYVYIYTWIMFLLLYCLLSFWLSILFTAILVFLPSVSCHSYRTHRQTQTQKHRAEEKGLFAIKKHVTMLCHGNLEIMIDHEDKCKAKAVKQHKFARLNVLILFEGGKKNNFPLSNNFSHLWAVGQSLGWSLCMGLFFCI